MKEDGVGGTSQQHHADAVDELDSMPIEEWLERVRGNYGRLANEFDARGVRNVADLKEIDEADFIILWSRIEKRFGDRKPHLTRIRREMKAVREVRGKARSARESNAARTDNNQTTSQQEVCTQMYPPLAKVVEGHFPETPNERTCGAHA